MVWFAIILAACESAACLLAGRGLIHYFQLESYQFPGFFRTLKRNILVSVFPGAVIASVMVLTWLIQVKLLETPDWVYVITSSAFALGAGSLFYFRARSRKAKKPMVFTPRIKRLYGFSFVLTFVLLFLILNLDLKSLLPAIFPLLLPVWIAFCGLAAWPVEKGISELYFRDAQRILREREDLIRIGITGSWGKTTVKYILGAMLGVKYNTLITPASFNTPMGVTKVIRSKLSAGYRVFVSEMGARHVGDIREMCRLVHPQIGILTSVGPQHLDTFKTLKRVTDTKYELIEALPDDGTAFFSDDDDIVYGLYQRTTKEKYLSGLHPERDDVWAEQITATPQGSSFLLCTKNSRIPCHTELLGELNVKNILLCASVCLRLGMSEKEIARAVSRVKSVEHRLQLLPGRGSYTVIDDAFNSNIRGAKQAFDVLRQFPAKRYIVTPGMVELGDREEEMNREFGRGMAGACDEALLIGKKRSVSISAGLKEEGFSEEKIHVFSSLDEASAWLRSSAGNGDTVLFENDLPDNYTE